MPEKATRLLKELGVSPEHRLLSYAVKGADDNYGRKPKPRSKPKIRPYQTLFGPPISDDTSDSEFMNKISAKFGHKTRISTYQMAEYLTLEARMGEEAARESLTEMESGEEDETGYEEGEVK